MNASPKCGSGMIGGGGMTSVAVSLGIVVRGSGTSTSIGRAASACAGGDSAGTSWMVSGSWCVTICA